MNDEEENAENRGMPPRIPFMQNEQENNDLVLEVIQQNNVDDNEIPRSDLPRVYLEPPQFDVLPGFNWGNLELEIRNERNRLLAMVQNHLNRDGFNLGNTYIAPVVVDNAYQPRLELRDPDIPIDEYGVIQKPASVSEQKFYEILRKRGFFIAPAEDSKEEFSANQPQSQP